MLTHLPERTPTQGASFSGHGEERLWSGQRAFLGASAMVADRNGGF